MVIQVEALQGRTAAVKEVAFSRTPVDEVIHISTKSNWDSVSGLGVSMTTAGEADFLLMVDAFCRIRFVHVAMAGQLIFDP